MAPPVRKIVGDPNEYRALTLPNQMKVLLVRQHYVEKAAVSLDVGVGLNSDPPEVPRSGASSRACGARWMRKVSERRLVSSIH